MESDKGSGVVHDKLGERIGHRRCHSSCLMLQWCVLVEVLESLAGGRSDYLKSVA